MVLVDVVMFVLSIVKAAYLSVSRCHTVIIGPLCTARAVPSFGHFSFSFCRSSLRCPSHQTAQYQPFLTFFFKSLIAALAVVATAAAAAATYTDQQKSKAVEEYEKTWKSLKEGIPIDAQFAGLSRAADAVWAELKPETRNTMLDFLDGRSDDLSGLEASELKFAQKYFDTMFAREKFVITQIADPTSRKINEQKLAAEGTRAVAAMQNAVAGCSAAATTPSADAVPPVPPTAPAAPVTADPSVLKMAKDVNKMTEEELKALTPEDRKSKVDKLKSDIQELKTSLKTASANDKPKIQANIKIVEDALRKLQGSSVLLWVILAVVLVSAVGAGIVFYMRK